MHLEKYSLGVGDRFGRQGQAQLRAIIRARDPGFLVIPVWNKSYREHEIIGTTPCDVREEADCAVQSLGWKDAYHVDADHIGMQNVGAFLSSSDFFTLDVANFKGKTAPVEEIDSFVRRHEDLIGRLELQGIQNPLFIDQDSMRKVASRYLCAIQEAGRIYRHILAFKGEGLFIAEISMDETDEPQSPLDMVLILAMVADEGIHAQTIAPKFTGRFNKGIDYVGDPNRFEEEFRSDLAVIEYAIERFGLPKNLKMSVHSGSDKFSIYPSISKALYDFNAGLHLKTAGTTWLEELIGLALSGSEGLCVVREIYTNALGRFDELCAPYAPVISIDSTRLPRAEEVMDWSGEEYAAALRHDPDCLEYNLHFRQMLHVSYKVAAEMGRRYLDALSAFEEVVGQNVEANLFKRHIRRVFRYQMDCSEWQ